MKADLWTCFSISFNFSVNLSFCWLISKFSISPCAIVTQWGNVNHLWWQYLRITTSNQVCVHVFVCMSTNTHGYMLSGNFSCSYYVHLLEITNWQLVCFAKSELISSSLCDITHEKKQTADAQGLTRLKKHSSIRLFELSHSQWIFYALSACM